MSEWFWPVVVCAVVVVGCAAVVAGGIRDTWEKYGHAEGGEITPIPSEDDADAAFASAMRMLNGEAADDAMDPIVQRIVAIVQNAIVEAEAVELDECEAEFLADPMHFGKRTS